MDRTKNWFKLNQFGLAMVGFLSWKPEKPKPIKFVNKFQYGSLTIQYSGKIIEIRDSIKTDKPVTLCMSHDMWDLLVFSKKKIKKFNSSL